MDRNVKEYGPESMTVCNCSFGIGQVCFMGYNNHCYWPHGYLRPSRLQPLTQDSGKHVEREGERKKNINNSVWWPNSTKSRVYFGTIIVFSKHVSVIIIPEVAHVWSQRATEQRSIRSALSGMDMSTWWGKQVLWLRLSWCRGEKLKMEEVCAKAMKAVWP